MTKIGKIILIFIITIIFFNKKIVSYYYIHKLSNWVERPVMIEQVKFKYSGYIEIKNIEILNSNRNYYRNIFKAEKITIDFETKSLFSNLIVVQNLNLLNPEFFLDIKVTNIDPSSGKRTIKYDDNIGLAKKINEKVPDKIWPQKDKDINFLVRNSILSGAKGNIKISSINKPAEIELSKMKFTSFGNDKNYRHYKDVLKSILYDLYARTEEINLKKTLKQIYKF